jgi:hypothetical protein
MFRPEISSVSIYFEDKNSFKNAPVVDGKIDSRAQSSVKDFLLKRDHELEEFAAKKLSDEQQGKINEITSFLTGKTSTSFANANKPTQDDFELDGFVSSGKVEVASATTD